MGPVHWYQLAIKTLEFRLSSRAFQFLLGQGQVIAWICRWSGGILEGFRTMMCLICLCSLAGELHRLCTWVGILSWISTRVSGFPCPPDHPQADSSRFTFEAVPRNPPALKSDAEFELKAFNNFSNIICRLPSDSPEPR